jgi:hypothetical protein
MEAAGAAATVAVVGGARREIIMSMINASSQMKRFPMSRTAQNIEISRGSPLLVMAAWALLLMIAAGVPLRAFGQQFGQKVFATPEEAVTALASAVEHNDEPAMVQLLGHDARKIVYSGDDTEDANSRAEFVAAYRQMHRLMREPDGTTTLYIGAKNWPTPIPLAHKGHDWYFDTDAAKREILYRRVGRNELSAIRVCKAMVAAQTEYHHIQSGVYAQKIHSDAGQHNGLYWSVAAGEAQSPIGPLVAAAAAEGYPTGKTGARPAYRGYHFHILTAQGKDAPGGAKSYLVDGKMTGGFAIIAYPAQYRSSGVMTFIVGSDGVVYQKDLGKLTEVRALATKRYDPDSSWHPAEDAPPKEAAGQSPATGL